MVIDDFVLVFIWRAPHWILACSLRTKTSLTCVGLIQRNAWYPFRRICGRTGPGWLSHSAITNSLPVTNSVRAVSSSGRPGILLPDAVSDKRYLGFQRLGCPATSWSAALKRTWSIRHFAGLDLSPSLNDATHW